MKMTMLALAFALAATPAVATAGQAQSAPVATDGGTPVPVAPVKPKKERRICRSNAASGTHMVKTICKTAAQWSGEDEASASGTDGVIQGNHAH